MEFQPKPTSGSRLRCKRRYGFCDTKCCCCCGVCGLIALLAVVALAAFIGATFGAVWPATDFTNTEYPGPDGTTLHAYVAAPTLAAGQKAPAAIVFHAWNGMSEEPVYFADRLAEAGYFAIAPDLFRNVASDEGNILRNIVNVINADQEQMNADADAALGYLQSRDDVNASHVVSGPGFCFGGAQSIIFATRHPTAATVTCYGSNIRNFANADSSNWGYLGSSPVLGIYGELDTRPAPAEAEAFGAALEKRGAAVNVSIYDGVGHAFITPHAHRDASDPTHPQATAAWSKILRFLDDVRRSAAPARQVSVEIDVDVNLRRNLGAAAIETESSLAWRIACAVKCALDFVVGGGHAHDAPAVGLGKLMQLAF